MDQIREKGSGYSSHLYFDMHIYTTHQLVEKWIREEKKREWLFLVIYTFDMHIYTTHRLKLKWIREEKKREWLFLRLY